MNIPISEETESRAGQGRQHQGSRLRLRGRHVSSYARPSDGSLNAHDGQVWFYDPQTQKVTLKLILAYDAVDSDQNFDGPDNITVSPYGGLMIAEDGSGLTPARVVPGPRPLFRS